MNDYPPIRLDRLLFYYLYTFTAVVWWGGLTGWSVVQL